MTLGAGQLDRFTEISVPIPNCFAVSTALPISIDWAMALSTELFDQIESDKPTASERELFSVILIMAVETAVINSVIELYISMLSEFAACGAGVLEESMAVVAALIECPQIDHRRIGKRHSECTWYYLFCPNCRFV